jgi:hypothetical protein
MSKTHAPGPYEVVVVEDAQGRKGEKWIMIRNEGGAIATVYPATESKETANLLAASWGLLEACKLARAVAQDQVDELETIAGADTALQEAKARLYTFEHAMEGLL